MSSSVPKRARAPLNNINRKLNIEESCKILFIFHYYFEFRSELKIFIFCAILFRKIYISEKNRELNFKVGHAVREGVNGGAERRENKGKLRVLRENENVSNFDRC